MKALLSLKGCLFATLVASVGCVNGVVEQGSVVDTTTSTPASHDSTPPPAAQTFTPLTNTPNFVNASQGGGPGLVQVLTDGRVLAEDADANDWWTLTPDNTGSYLNGTWTQVASPPNGYSPLYFASAVLPDGRFFAGGGEYDGGSTGVWTTQAAIYDPVADQWTAVTAPSGWMYIGDAQSVVLADGRYMMADCCELKSAILDPSTLTWTTIGTGKEETSYDEEGWTLLPDGRVLTTDADNTAKPMESEIFNPATGAWTSDGSTVVQLADNTDRESPPSEELGPAVLRPDGTVLATGAIGHNAVYNTATSTWSAAPDFPSSSGGQLDCSDAPAALEPNGNVLIATSPLLFAAGVVFFEWDGTKFNQLTATTAEATQLSSYEMTMLVLPTGEIFVTSQSTDAEIYEPAPAADTSAIEPVITAVPTLQDESGFTDEELDEIHAVEGRPIASDATADLLPLTNIYKGRTYTVAGKRLNGISQGGAYGDDEQTSTAFPLVRFTNQATGHVQYGRTHDGSNYSIALTATGTTNVDVPSTIESGLSNMQVVANGIASPAILVNVK
jgi:hypothetical protein